MAGAAESWKHRLGDVLLVLGAGYLGLSAIGGPLFLPYDLALAVAALGLAAWVGDYKARWWPTARYREREHELNSRPGDRSPK